jgi:hypothetical protein
MTEKKTLRLKIKRTAAISSDDSPLSSPKPKRTLRLGTKKRIIVNPAARADISKTFSNTNSKTVPQCRKSLKKKRRIINTPRNKAHAGNNPYPIKAKRAAPKKPNVEQTKKIPPSKIKAQQLEALLSERFDAWRTNQPLQLGIERQIFQLIGAEHLPYSKRVVQKVLSRHTRSREYLENTLRMNTRVSLQNTVSGNIQEKDKNYAKEKIKNH